MTFLNTGCTKKSSDVTVVTTGLSFTAQIVFDSMEFTCFTEIQDSHKTVFTLVEPLEIEGLKVIFDKGKTSMEYDGLNHALSDTFLNITPFDLIYKIFMDASDNKDLKIKTDENMIFSSVDSADYTIKVGQTGLPIEIKCPFEKLSVIIKNCTIT